MALLDTVTVCSRGPAIVGSTTTDTITWVFGAIDATLTITCPGELVTVAPTELADTNDTPAANGNVAVTPVAVSEPRLEMVIVSRTSPPARTGFGLALKATPTSVSATTWVLTEALSVDEAGLVCWHDADAESVIVPR